jgi:predicted phosphodiesterase
MDQRPDADRGGEPARAPDPAEGRFPSGARRLVAAGRWARARAGEVGERWPWLRVVVFALAGAVLAVALFGRVPAKVGPFETTVGVRPSLSGTTVVRLAPLGTIELDTHDWPVAFDLRLEEIGLADAERIARNPSAIDRLGIDAADEVRDAFVRLAIRCVLLALAGGVAGALAARLSWRAAAGGVGVAALLVVVLAVGILGTLRTEAVAEPRYTGLLTRAPTAVGDIEDVIDRFGEYRAQLSDLVDNMAALYLAGEDLPTFEPDDDLIRVLHVSDVHLNVQAFDMMERLVDQFGVDVIADTGDLTDWGTSAESRVVSRIGDLPVPYVFVRGNHDSHRTQDAVADQPNAVVLDGESATVAGLRFWGVGDPRYTPDKSQEFGDSEQERAEAFAPTAAEGLLEAEPPPVDVAMVHDERMAGDLGGLVPLVLAGHTHQPAESILSPPEVDDEDDDATDDDASDDDASDDEGTDDEGTDGSADGTSTSGSVTGGVDRDAAGEAFTEDRDGDGEADDTLLRVEGSTGGAGLRGLQGEEPEPLTASILYFDPDTRSLVAYDSISVAWLEDAGATIERHIVGDLDAPAAGSETSR